MLFNLLMFVIMIVVMANIKQQLRGPNIRLTGVNTEVFAEFDDGQNVSISDASEARMRYNAAANQLQQSLNGAAYTPVSLGGKIYATQVIGHDGEGDTAADVDQLCDGTADNVQIQAAHDALPANGGVILIRRGNYLLATTVNITKSNVTLIGEGTGSTIITGPNASVDLFSVTGPDDHLEIAHIKFVDGYATPANICFDINNYDDVYIHDCEFESAAGYRWFAIDWSHTSNIENFRCERNKFIGGGSTGSKAVVYVENTVGFFFNVFINDNSFEATEGHAIRCVRGENATVNRNQFNGVTAAAAVRSLIFLGSCDHFSVSHNVFRSSVSLLGIRTDASEHGSIMGNVMDGNVAEAIEVDNNSIDVVVIGNVVKSTGVVAQVFRINGDRMLVDGNYLQGNTGTGIAMNVLTSEVVISNNIIKGCLIGIKTSAANQVTIKGNYMDGLGITTTFVDINALCVEIQISDNYFRLPLTQAILLDAKGSVKDNQFINSSASAIGILLNNVNASGSHISGNSFDTLATGISLIAVVTDVVIGDNTFDNVTTDISDLGSRTVILPSNVDEAGSELNYPYKQTLDATPATLFSLTLKDNTVYNFKARVSMNDTAGVERAAYERTVRAHRQGAGIATLGAIQTDFTDETNDALNCTWSTSGNDILLLVTGIAATTIDWTAVVDWRST